MDPISETPPPMPPPSPAVGGGPSKDDRNLAMFCHLGGFVGWIIPFGNIITPLIIWLVKREQSAFVDDQGKEALNFQITMTILAIVCSLLIFVFIGFLLLPALLIYDLVLIIVAAIKSQEGEAYRYPLTLRLI